MNPVHFFLTPSTIFSTRDVPFSSKNSKNVDLSAMEHSLSTQARMWRIIDIAVKVAIIGIALLITSYTWASFKATSLVLSSVITIGLGFISYDAASLLFFEKAKRFLKEANYVAAVIQKSKFFESNAAAVTAFCTSHHIDLKKFPETCDRSCQLILLSELACKEEEVQSLMTKIESNISSTEVVDLRYKFGTIKIEAAALLIFLQDPTTTPPTAAAVLGPLETEDRYGIFPITAKRVFLININRKFAEVISANGDQKDFTFAQIQDTSIEDLAKTFV